MTPRSSAPAILMACSVLFLLAHARAFADHGLYEPRKADFPCHPEPAYGKGDCNVYFGRVQTFYRGSFLTKGWTQYATQLLSRIRDDARPRLAGKINVLGQTIAAEWAKENAYRRIFTVRSQGHPNLQDLVDRLNEVTQRDAGSAGAVEAFLDNAQRVAEKAIRGEELSAAERVWK